ncbi:Oxidoreductase-like domain-containing protein [Mycena kentingensis (nom. inval.)]|nr:Oxidoreductase-like domain-containing protein [Mycena kentingensis (nom. inval.)]
MNILGIFSRRLLSTVADDGAVARLRPAAADALKRPIRGGQNLSLRYRRLEQSLRGKAALRKDRDVLEPHTPGVEAAKRPAVVLFRGMEVPQEPKAPASDECCMSGCAVCVYDLYEESLTAYRDALAAFRSTLVALGVPQAEWPAATRSDGGTASKSVVKDAFEELERALAAKQSAMDAGGAAPVLGSTTILLATRSVAMDILRHQSIRTPSPRPRQPLEPLGNAPRRRPRRQRRAPGSLKSTLVVSEPYLADIPPSISQGVPSPIPPLENVALALLQDTESLLQPNPLLEELLLASPSPPQVQLEWAPPMMDLIYDALMAFPSALFENDIVPPPCDALWTTPALVAPVLYESDADVSMHASSSNSSIDFVHNPAYPFQYDPVPTGSSIDFLYGAAHAPPAHVFRYEGEEYYNVPTFLRLWPDLANTPSFNVQWHHQPCERPRKFNVQTTLKRVQKLLNRSQLICSWNGCRRAVRLVDIDAHFRAVHGAAIDEQYGACLWQGCKACGATRSGWCDTSGSRI